MFERPRALVHGVDLPDLGAAGRGRERHVGVAARLGQDRHLVVDSTESTPGRVRERPVAVDEGVAQVALPIEARQAPVASQPVDELQEHGSRSGGGVGGIEAVMEVDLDLPPSRPAMFGQTAHDPLVVLLGGKEVRVAERPAVIVAPLVTAAGYWRHHASRRRSCSERRERRDPALGRWRARSGRDPDDQVLRSMRPRAQGPLRTIGQKPGKAPDRLRELPSDTVDRHFDSRYSFAATLRHPSVPEVGMNGSS